MLVVLRLEPLFLGYLLIAPPGNQPAAAFGEMLGFALAFSGAFVAHVLIWRSYPGGSWWSSPETWPPKRKLSSDRSKGPQVS